MIEHIRATEMRTLSLENAQYFVADDIETIWHKVHSAAENGKLWTVVNFSELNCGTQSKYHEMICTYFEEKYGYTVEFNSGHMKLSW